MTTTIPISKSCQCEHIDHEDNGTHTPGVHVHESYGVPAGTRRAQHVGPVCDECAEMHMSAYLLPPAPAPELPVSLNNARKA